MSEEHKSTVNCIGDGVKGCGYVGGTSGRACPECGGMLLSERSLLSANKTTIAWLAGLFEMAKSERDAALSEVERLKAEVIRYNAIAENGWDLAKRSGRWNVLDVSVGFSVGIGHGETLDAAIDDAISRSREGAGG